MKHIDYLPSRYREQTALRRAQVWRMAALAVIGMGLGTAAVGQYSIRLAVTRQLAGLAGPEAAARARTEQLAQLQTQLEQVSSTAQLYAYLRHPWPRTQILAAVADKLPPALTLSELRIGTQTNAGPDTRARPPVAREGDGKETQVSAAASDLQRLKDQYDTGHTLVEVSGLTSELAPLYAYVARLGESPLFSKCELTSLEATGDRASPTQSRFKLRLTVRPGYGQRGGPEVGADTMAASTAGYQAERRAP